jgi:hypothetical protein
LHLRLQNELAFRLSREALRIIGRNLPEHERRQRFDELYRAFKEEVLRYDEEKKLMEARLRGVPPVRHAVPCGDIDQTNSNGV